MVLADRERRADRRHDLGRRGRPGRWSQARHGRSRLHRDDERRGLGPRPARRCGWTIEIADARKVKAIAPLACKTDRVDARVLADLARRDLVPTVWVPPLDDRAIRERLRRRSHLIRLRTSSINRTFGLLTQWGLRRNLTALREPGALDELAERGVPEVWRHSIATLLASSTISTASSRRSSASCGHSPAARARPAADEHPRRRRAARAHDRVRDRRHLALPVRAQARRLLRPDPQDQAIRPELPHRPALQGRARHAALGCRRGLPAGLAPNNPWHQLYTDIKRRHGKANPAKAAVARKVLIASWHILSLGEPFKPSAPRATDPVPASSSIRLAA